MPNFDGTGPAGMGPKTGGQRGYCKGARPRPRPMDGRGMGMGRGMGRGMGMGRASGVDSGMDLSGWNESSRKGNGDPLNNQELDLLKQQASDLKYLISFFGSVCLSLMK